MRCLRIVSYKKNAKTNEWTNNKCLVSAQWGTGLWLMSLVMRLIRHTVGQQDVVTNNKKHESFNFFLPLLKKDSFSLSFFFRQHLDDDDDDRGLPQVPIFHCDTSLIDRCLIKYAVSFFFASLLRSIVICIISWSRREFMCLRYVIMLRSTRRSYLWD